MSLFRLVAAFLFAVVVVVVAYGIFWFTAFRMAEHKMTSALQSEFGLMVSYEVPQWQPELGKVSVRLPQVLVRAAMPGGEVMVMQMPDVLLESGFFEDANDLSVYLPPVIDVRIMRQDQEVAAYKITMSEGELLLLKNSVLLSNEAAQIMQGDKLLMSWVNGQLKWEPLPDSAGRVLLQARQVDGVAGVADDVSFRGTLLGMQNMTAPTWALMRLANKEALAAWLKNGIKALSRGGELVVDGLTVKQGDWNVALSGSVSVDKDGVPYGDVVVQSNSGDTVAQVLELSNLIEPVKTEERMRYDQAMVKLAQGETQGKLILHQGVAILNTLRVGRVPSATTAVKSWL